MRLATLACFALSLTVPVIPVSAQPDTTETGSVAGSGTVVIKRMPERMRAKVQLTASGKDLRAALASLKDRTDAARVQLKTLGADSDSVKVDDAQISEAADDRQKQMEMLMAQRLRGRKPPKKTDAKPPVTVAALLTAEWPLKAENTEKLLVDASSLQDKIKAADLAGTKIKPELSPEEQEALEELEASGVDEYGNEEESNPGEPIFLFVSKVTDQEREKAMAEAYEKARRQAADVAKAAGAELGKLKYLAGNDQAVSGDEDPFSQIYGNSSARAYRMMQMMQAAAVSDQDEPTDNEAVGMQPKQVSYRVSITASFELAIP